MKTAERNFGLDLVRAVAICLVLMAHFAQGFYVFGFFGVELFFALSGFLIGSILWRDYSTNEHWARARIGNFWQRRWFRTVPNYFLFLGVSIAFYAWQYGTAGLSGLSDYFWFGQDFTKRSGTVYGVSWSLCIEEWFYLTFPLALFAFDRILASNKHVTFLSTILFFFIASFIIRDYLFTSGTDNVREITIGRLDSIGCGVLLAYVYNTCSLSRLQSLRLAVLGVLLLALGAVINVWVPTTTGEASALILVPFGCALLMPLLTLTPRPANKAVETWITNLSLWSYSIYLAHIPMLFTLYHLLDDVMTTSLGKLFVKALALAMTLVISRFVYQRFEIPLMLLRPKALPKQVPVKSVTG